MQCHHLHAYSWSLQVGGWLRLYTPTRVMKGFTGIPIASEISAEGSVLHQGIYAILYSLFVSLSWTLSESYNWLLVLVCASGGVQIQQSRGILDWSYFAVSTRLPVPRVYQLLGNFHTWPSKHAPSLWLAFSWWLSPSNIVRIYRTHSCKLT